MPPNPKLSSRSLDNLGGTQRVQAERQCVFLSSLLILLHTCVPILQLQPLPAPQFSGSSLLCSHITLLSEALGASSLLYLLVTSFPHSFLGPTLLLGTADCAPGSFLPWSLLRALPGTGEVSGADRCGTLAGMRIAWSGWMPLYKVD